MVVCCYFQSIFESDLSVSSSSFLLLLLLRRRRSLRWGVSMWKCWTIFVLQTWVKLFQLTDDKTFFVYQGSNYAKSFLIVPKIFDIVQKAIDLAIIRVALVTTTILCSLSVRWLQNRSDLWNLKLAWRTIRWSPVLRFQKQIIHEWMNANSFFRFFSWTQFLISDTKWLGLLRLLASKQNQVFWKQANL